ncbi:hypothetical protein [Methanococcus maripaludis]|uniref:Uncharacterized protein n=1 Tax=Methanococcus maripaludis TaxID=39152 RepID=A0A7J9PE74_METMI|nr:hypothetical protein [Methanococcus maripaludis]MBA2860970.1 hypothetical protein [Methanococcus maripaludis]
MKLYGKEFIVSVPPFVLLVAAYVFLSKMGTVPVGNIAFMVLIGAYDMLQVLLNKIVFPKSKRIELPKNWLDE